VAGRPREGTACRCLPADTRRPRINPAGMRPPSSLVRAHPASIVEPPVFAFPEIPNSRGQHGRTRRRIPRGYLVERCRGNTARGAFREVRPGPPPRLTASAGNAMSACPRDRASSRSDLSTRYGAAAALTSHRLARCASSAPPRATSWAHLTCARSYRSRAGNGESPGPDPAARNSPCARRHDRGRSTKGSFAVNWRELASQLGHGSSKPDRASISRSRWRR